MRSFCGLALVASLVAPAGAVGRAAQAQQSSIPVHQLGAIVARDTDTLANFTSIRPLSDGRVLLNDVARRRLVLLDATLQHAQVLADTTAATTHLYGSGPPLPGASYRPSGLSNMTAWLGDSTLIVDDATNAFIVIDPEGRFARIIPAPRAASAPPGQPGGALMGADLAGHLLYHQTRSIASPQLPPTFMGDTSVRLPDSTVVRRVSLATWRSDTIARLLVPETRVFVTRSAMSYDTRSATSPIASADDAALACDGSLAIVRAYDYHVDWVAADGRTTSGPPIPIDWVHISSSRKVAIMDSIRASDSVSAVKNAVAAAARGQDVFQPPRTYVLASDLPDDVSPFLTGQTRADADGNVWIRVSNPSPPPTFDVIDRRGERVDRIELPLGATLLGFGPGVVYYTNRARRTQAGRTVFQLVEARIH
ncbi:MAG TPA: hypothetical protein VMH39_06720 [Gemmatimonadaceae bacterium]|nr:hypothetical protein [Gemmatimonadaceae bacterium]